MEELIIPTHLNGPATREVASGPRLSDEEADYLEYFETLFGDGWRKKLPNKKRQAAREKLYANRMAEVPSAKEALKTLGANTKVYFQFRNKKLNRYYFIVGIDENDIILALTFDVSGKIKWGLFAPGFFRGDKDSTAQQIKNLPEINLTFKPKGVKESVLEAASHDLFSNMGQFEEFFDDVFPKHSKWFREDYNRLYDKFIAMGKSHREDKEKAEREEREEKERARPKELTDPKVMRMVPEHQHGEAKVFPNVLAKEGTLRSRIENLGEKSRSYDSNALHLLHYYRGGKHWFIKALEGDRAYGFYGDAEDESEAGSKWIPIKELTNGDFDLNWTHGPTALHTLVDFYLGEGYYQKYQDFKKKKEEPKEEPMKPEPKKEEPKEERPEPAKKKEEPKEESKKHEPEPQESPAPKPNKRDPQKVAGKKVRAKSFGLTLVRSFLNMLGEKVVADRPITLLKRIEKGLVDGKVDVFKDEVMEIKAVLEKNLAQIKTSKTVTINVKNQQLLEDLQAASEAEVPWDSISLVKRFIGLKGSKPDKEKVNRLLTAIDRKLKRNAISAKDPYRDKVKEIKRYLEGYLQAPHSSIPVSSVTLNGLAGLAGIPTDQIDLVGFMSPR